MNMKLLTVFVILGLIVLSDSWGRRRRRRWVRRTLRKARKVVRLAKKGYKAYKCAKNTAGLARAITLFGDNKIDEANLQKIRKMRNEDIHSYQGGMLAMAEELTNSMSDQEAEETLQRFDALVRRETSDEIEDEFQKQQKAEDDNHSVLMSLEEEPDNNYEE